MALIAIVLEHTHAAAAQVGAALQAAIALCDRQPVAVLLGIALLWGLARFCRAIRAAVTFGEPVAGRLAIAGAVAGAAAAALRPYVAAWA